MGFILTELIVETILRDGLEKIRESIGTADDAIDIIFSEMTQPYLNYYYGQAEINKIKTLIKAPIEISQGYPLSDIKVPYIGINLQSANESQPLALIADYAGFEETSITPETLIGPFDADSYNPVDGIVDATSSNVDLSAIHTSSIWVDGDGVSHTILGGIKNEVGLKTFAISTGLSPSLNLTQTKFISSISTEVRKIRKVRESENVLLLIGSENALSTKYLFTIVKYIFLSQRAQRIARGLAISSYDGTDFSRADRLPDNWFTRFMTIKSSVIEHSWTETPVDQIGDILPIINVPQDEYPRPNQEDLTVHTIEVLGDE